ncbi:substrate-binding periplasmic protein [Pseudodesulfovibrio nedwellii]|nr:transporter substrate-binding domain-containing protein [Pseudodesulfovibrio nedwellii]
MKFFVSLLLTIFIACPAFAGQALVLAMGEDDTTAATGILAILKTAYSRIGIEVKGKVLPANRALVDSNTGYIDGELCRIADIESEHPNLIRIPVTIMTVDIMAYTIKNSFPIKGWKSLEERRIGIKAGLRYAEIRTQGMPNVLRTTNHDTLFKLLAANRLDVVIATRSIHPAQSEKAYVKKFYAHEPPLAKLELYHYLHIKHAELVPLITEVLSRMHESGEMDKIRNSAMQTKE